MSYIKLVLSLGLVAVYASGEARATHLAGSPPDFNSDCIAVLVDDDNSLFDAAGKMNRAATANRFYQTHGDDYDFLMIFPAFNGQGSNHLNIFNDLAGVGQGPRDNRAQYGASDTLQSITAYTNFTNFPLDPEARIPGNNDSTFSLLAQEVGHRWTGKIDIDGVRAQGGRSNTHWSYYFQATSTGPRNGASSLEGNAWVDNGDDTFTTVAMTDGFSRLDQYLIGLRAASAVDPFFYISNPSEGKGLAADKAPSPPDTVNGTRVDWTISDVIDENGARVPDFAAAPKSFTQAFILVSNGATPAQAVIDRLDAIRTGWEAYFNEETDFLESLDTCIRLRPIDVVFLLDVSGSFGPDLANFQAEARPLAEFILEKSPGSRFALATFSDFPFSPFGSATAGDYAYRLDLPLTDNLDDFDTAVQGATILNALDLPQSQYEAIFQVLTGAGRDLNGNGNFTDLGDIAPSDIGAAADAPLFIFLFTDAAFHDPDTEADYPVPGAVTAGRTAVLQELMNTPFLFGLVSGPDNAQLEELSDLTGGAVFVVADDSSGFEEAVVEAIEVTDVSRANLPLPLLDDLTIAQAAIHWNERGNPAKPRVGLSGSLELPSGVSFQDFIADTETPGGKLIMTLGEDEIVMQDLSFSTRSAHDSEWMVKTDLVHLMLRWTNARTARYWVKAEFDAAAFGRSGSDDADELDFVLSLMGAEEMLSGNSVVAAEDWHTKDKLWKTR